MPPININECFLQRPRDGRRLRLSPWAPRFSGGFVVAYRWFALGVGLDVAWRWFLLILSLGRVRVSFGRSGRRRFRFIIPLVRVRVSVGRYVWCGIAVINYWRQCTPSGLVEP